METRCLGPGRRASKFAVNSDVVREYLTALAKSGQLSRYGDGEEGGAPDPGRSHRSLPRLLAELQAAAAGRGEAAAAAPGATVAAPLHVVVQVGG